MFFGITIIIIGLIFLLKNTGLIVWDVWPILWPSLLIALGLSVLMGKKRRERRWEKIGEKMHKLGEEFHKTFNEEE